MACNEDYCEVETYPERYDLDGCYFRVERDGKFDNVCFSDLTEQERGKVMANKGVPWFISLCNHLADSLHAIGEAFEIHGREE